MLAIEKPLPASFISVSTAFVFPVILIALLWPLGLTGIWLNFAGTALLAGIMSVSYTHLDVYKRQAYILLLRTYLALELADLNEFSRLTAGFTCSFRSCLSYFIQKTLHNIPPAIYAYTLSLIHI